MDEEAGTRESGVVNFKRKWWASPWAAAASGCLRLQALETERVQAARPMRGPYAARLCSLPICWR